MSGPKTPDSAPHRDVFRGTFAQTPGKASSQLLSLVDKIEEDSVIIQRNPSPRSLQGFLPGDSQHPRPGYLIHLPGEGAFWNGASNFLEGGVGSHARFPKQREGGGGDGKSGANPFHLSFRVFPDG